MNRINVETRTGERKDSAERIPAPGRSPVRDVLELAVFALIMPPLAIAWLCGVRGADPADNEADDLPSDACPDCGESILSCRCVAGE